MSHDVCLQTNQGMTALLRIVLIVFCTVAINESALPQVPSVTSCEKISPCSCYLQHRGIINLGAVKIPNNSQFFRDDTKDLTCEWNPCKEFTDKDSQGVCRNTRLCKKEKKNDTYHDLGSEAVFQYISSSDKVVMLYNAGNQRTEISLNCSETVSFKIMPGYNSTNLSLTFSSPCACPGGCTKGLSPGSILCIVFFSLVTGYFAVGALYRKAVFQSVGLDLIPHLEFWRELPGLIKDGYLFFISPCLGNNVQYASYQRVPGHNFEDAEEREDNEQENQLR